MKKIIALADYGSNGHHIGYMQIYAETMMKLGYQVVIVTSEPGNLKDWAIDKEVFLGRITAPGDSTFFLARFRGFMDRYNQWKEVARGVQQLEIDNNIKVDFVFFMWLDGMIKAIPSGMQHLLPRAMPYNWGGLAFHVGMYYLPRFTKSKNSTFPTDFFKMRNCKMVTTLDEIVLSKIQEAAKGRPVVALPDAGFRFEPDLNLGIVKKIKEKAGDRKIVGLLGSLSHRKGIEALARAAKEMPDTYFVFVGKLGGAQEVSRIDGFLKLVSEKPENTYFHFEYVTDQEFDSVVSICDVIYAAYINFPSSSNLLIKAAQFQKPIIVSKGFLMEKRIEQFKIGEVIEQGNVSQIRLAISKLLKFPIPLENYRDYTKEHSFAKLQEKLGDILSKAIV